MTKFPSNPAFGHPIMPSLYNLILTGQVLPGHSLDDVAPRLAKIMHVPESQAANLLLGVETVIKRHLASEQLPRYLEALGRAGAEARAERMDAHGNTPTTTRETRPTPSERPTGKSPYDQPAPSLMFNSSTATSLTASSPPMTLSIAVDDRDHLRGQPATSTTARAKAAETPPTLTRASKQTSHLESDRTPAAFALALSGRIGRIRYLAYSLPAYVPMILGAVAMALLRGPGMALMAAGGLISFWMMVRVLVLRLHDLNLSGKWVLLPCLTALLSIKATTVGILATTVILVLGSLFLIFAPGSNGDNDYGPPPGDNTLLNMIGAALCLLLMLGSGYSKPTRFMPQDSPTEQVVEE